MRTVSSNMARKIGSSCLGDELMTRNRSVVAVCCSTASFSSRLSRATSVSWLVPDGLLLRNRFGDRALLLRDYRAAWRFSWFAARSGAPFHWLPDYSRDEAFKNLA